MVTIIQAKSENDLTLGRQGENLARQVVFDLSAWEAEYGPGVAELIHQRPGDAAPYPVAAVREGGTLVWTLTSADTDFHSDYGSCELRYYVGDVLVKSRTWLTKVIRAMSTPSETAPPEPEQGWVDQVLAAGAAAKASADAAKADADRAAALAAEVSKKAAQTAKDAVQSAQAKEAAQTAQRLAEAAQKAAETAKQAAETAQSAAEQAATDADGAKQAAEAALKATQDAASEAAQSLSALRALYQEMQEWAAGVVQSVSNEGARQVQAVRDEGTQQTANAKAHADAAKSSADNAAQSAAEAQNAKTGAETSRDAAVTAQGKAETAQKGAEDAKTEAEASKNASAKSKTAAKLSEQNSKASEDAAKASETASAGSASAAAKSATAAQTAQSGAEAAQSAAEQSAQEAAESAAVYDDVVADVNQLKADLDDLIEITTNAETSWVEVGEYLDSVQVQANKYGTYVTLASGSEYTAKKLILSNEKLLRLTFNASNNVQYGVGYFCTTLDGQILFQYNTEKHGKYTVEIEVSGLPSGTQVIYVNNNASAMVPNIESFETERLFKSYTKDETDSMILLNDMYPLMFSRLAVIGDSLSSGELVYKNESGEWIYEDRYGNSWLSYLAREYGASARTHYAAGGMTCKRWLDDYTAKINRDAPFNAYFIALGTNDAYKKPYELGTIDDAVGSNTFAGYYKQIVELVRAKAPNAVIFCVSTYNGNKESPYNQMIQSISELYDGCFYVDLVNKADLSLADGGVFVSGSHFTTLGYIRIARNIAHLVNEIVVENGEWFKFFALNNSVGDKFND